MRPLPTFLAAALLFAIPLGGATGPTVVKAWSFDDDPGCQDAGGWESTLDAGAGPVPATHADAGMGWSLSGYDVDTPACAWDATVDAMMDVPGHEGRDVTIQGGSTGALLHGMAPFVRAELASPASECVALPVGALQPRLSFRERGVLDDLATLSVLARPCDGSSDVLLGTFGAADAPVGTASAYGTLEVDLAPALASGPFRVVFRLDTRAAADVDVVAGENELGAYADVLPTSGWRLDTVAILTGS